MLFERMTYHLIKYNKTAPWCRGVRSDSEGFMVGFFLCIWSYAILFIGVAIPETKTSHLCVNAFAALSAFGFVIAFYLSIKQHKGKIKNKPILLSDKAVKIVLAMYLLVPLASGLISFFMLFSHHFFHWFSFMD